MRYVRFLVLLLMFLNHPVMAEDVSMIEVSPDQFEPFGNVTVSVSADSTVDDMSLTYCRISPDYLCYFPSYKMDATDDGFSVTFELKDDEGAKVGFSLLYVSSDGSSHKLPTSSSSDYGIPVEEPVDDTFYFVFEIGGSSTKSPSPGLLFPVLASLYIMPLLVRRR